MNPNIAAHPAEADVRAVERLGEARKRILAELRKNIVGMDEVIDQLLIAIFARGHCLLVGVPGLAKTLLVSTLAESLSLTFRRIQFTPDLMPSDITGTEILQDDPETGKRQFMFSKGPVFSHIILADEINRTPPKTQSALLEAMQERSVTVRGQQHALEPPFFVLATQNPIELEGTYPLPEAQLDRFLFNVILDHLGAEDELTVLDRFTTRVDVPEVRACTDAQQLLRFQWLVRQVPASEQISRYAVQLVRATRPSDALAPKAIRSYVKFGASVRATMYLLLSAKARALLDGRYHVTEADLRALALPVLRHRVLTNYQAESDGHSVDDVLRALLEARAA
jgi:MoxR-like ATPase